MNTVDELSQTHEATNEAGERPLQPCESHGFARYRCTFVSGRSPGRSRLHRRVPAKVCGQIWTSSNFLSRTGKSRPSEICEVDFYLPHPKDTPRHDQDKTLGAKH